ncbi:glycosyltransferase family 4 protein [Acinetobacter sp.]|uniref:glycosyltransferase family 4 protein n=1 Tax=Acinetobacter sp. TaxID=472 RepID=UPI000C4B8270|nr:glycosyltransferase family 4 protein [Acinetobacter sp.]MBC70321.1 glycosyl transferase family 1 [Acinetobacter sp.]
MKIIAITSNTSWYLYNFRKNTILQLVKKNYEVIAISPDDKYSEKLKQLGCKHINIVIDKNGKNIFVDLWTIISYLNILRKYKPKIILSFTPKCNIYSTLAANIIGIGSINNISGLGSIFIKASFTKYFLRFLYKLSQSKADVIFFQNSTDKKIFEKNKIALNVKKILIPGSGVDLKKFKFSKKKKNKVTKFLLASRLIIEKGINYYIKSAEILKNKYGNNVEFYLIGLFEKNNPSGIHQDTILDWERKKIIKFLGSTDRMNKEISKIDCFVLPTFYGEGVPRSLLEAASMGKPIITTNHPGCKDVVKHNYNGFLVKPRSLEQLTSYMDKFINLPHAHRLKMGKRGSLKMKKEFDEKIIIDKYLGIINKYFE